MLRNPRTIRPLVVAIGALLLVTVVLSGALTGMALRDTPVRVVPGIREDQIRVPGEIPDAAALKFSLLYLSYFDGYTPETVEDRSNYILRFVAPEHLEKVARALSERATYVLKTRESSQLTLPPPFSPPASGVSRLPGGVLRVSVVAERRIYIASQLKTVQRIRYELDLRPSLPPDRDAFGFQVVGQHSRAVSDEEGEAGREGDGDP